MYNEMRTEDYISAINSANGREFEYRIAIGGDMVLTKKDVTSVKLTYSQPNSCIIGNALSQKLVITMVKNEHVYESNIINLEIGIKINNEYKYIQMGVFNIDKVENKQGYQIDEITITAYDNMYKLDQNYLCNITGVKVRLNELAKDIAKKSGIAWDGVIDPSTNYLVDKPTQSTYRKVLSNIAGVLGCNAVCNRDGSFGFRKFKDTLVKINANNYSSFTPDSLFTVGRVYTSGADKDVVYTKGNLTPNTMDVKYKNVWMTQQITDSIGTEIIGLSYYGHRLECFGDLTFDFGDIITVEDVHGDSYKVLLGNISLDFNGGLKASYSAKADSKSSNSFSQNTSGTEKIKEVVTEIALVNKALVNMLTVDDLVAEKIKVDLIEGNTANLQQILTNFISGKQGQFIHLTGGNVVIDDGVITNAMIKDLSAGKITTGDIITDLVTVRSSDGSLNIKGNLITMKDGNNVIRIQIGKDGTGEYSFTVLDKDGNIQWNSNGVTGNGINSGVIANNHVADNANIHGSKLDIDSVINEVNENGSTSFKASKVAIDDKGQTLDVAFTEINKKIDNIGFLSMPNMLVNTRDLRNVDYASAYLTDEKYKNFKVLHSKTTNTEKDLALWRDLEIKSNTKYTLSFYAKGSGDIYSYLSPNTCKSAINSCGNTSTANDGQIKTTLSSEWTRYWITFTTLGAVSGLKRLLPVRQKSNCEVWVCGFKLEENKINTDWCPHVDDIYQVTESLQTSVNVHQGNIEQLIKDTTITTEDGKTTKLKDDYSSYKATTNSVKVEVSKIQSGMKTGDNMLHSIDYAYSTNPNSLLSYSYSQDNVHVFYKTGNTDGLYGIIPLAKSLTAGKEYTFSIKVKNNLLNPKTKIGLWNSLSGVSTTNCVYVAREANKEALYSITFNATGLEEGIAINSADMSVNQSIEIYYAKIEKGSTVTDPCLCIEDATDVVNKSLLPYGEINNNTWTLFNYTGDDTQMPRCVISDEMLDGYKVYELIGNGDSSKVDKGLILKVSGLTVGNQYTFSFKYKSSSPTSYGNSNGLLFVCNKNNNARLLQGITPIVDNKWHTICETFKAEEDAVNLRIILGGLTSVSLSQAKLENGYRRSKYIDTYEGKIEQTSLELLPDKIVEKVSSNINTGGSLVTTSATLDKKGWHIVNGGLDITDKNGQKVFGVDTSGNMEYKGNIRSKNPTTGDETILSAGGLYQKIGSNYHEYHHLAYQGSFGGGTGTSSTFKKDDTGYWCCDIQLPDEFKGKTSATIQASLKGWNCPSAGATWFRSPIRMHCWADITDYKNAKARIWVYGLMEYLPYTGIDMNHNNIKTTDEGFYMEVAYTVFA